LVEWVAAELQRTACRTGRPQLLTRLPAADWTVGLCAPPPCPSACDCARAGRCGTAARRRFARRGPL